MDIYSLGCVAWCMLTGRNVFRGELAHILTDHLNTEPEPPSRYARAAISPELDEIVLQCLNKKPEHRPSSTRDLGLMFDAVALAEPWTQDRAEAWWRTHVPELTLPRPSPQSPTVADSQ